MDRESDDLLDDLPPVDLIPFGDFLAGLVALDPQVGDDQMTLWVERMNLELPVELGIGWDERGQLAVEASPPTQHLATSVLPVFHQLRVAFARDDERQ